MSLIFDVNGFYKMELFLYLSIALLYFVHKKGYKYVMLPIIPLLLVPLYQGHIDSELIAREQITFLSNRFNEVYQLDIISSIKEKEETKNTLYDSWAIDTGHGVYNVRFNSGSSNGFEIYDIKDNSESLIVRKNILELMASLDLDGELVLKDKTHYELLGSGDTYTIKINSKGRVDEIINDENNKIYKNEENLQPEDGQTLNKGDFD